MMGFRRNHGLRIDHILISEPLVASCKSCMIDKTPRKLERPPTTHRWWLKYRQQG